MNSTAHICRRLAYVLLFLPRLYLCFSFSLIAGRRLTIELRSLAGDNGGGESAGLHRGTTYSWINPKLQTIDSAEQKGNNTESSTSERRYKRIQFDGCGSILLHCGTSSITSLQHTGLSLWSAAYVMSYYIDDMWSQEIRSNQATKWTVLDLGAGLGLCSAVAAKHAMNVVSTDSDSQALVLLEENLRRNCDDNGSISVHSLDWIAAAEQADITTNPVFVELEKYAGVDLVMLSDVVYSATKPGWKALIVLLEKLRSQRMRLIQGKSPAIVERKRCDATDTPASDPLVLLSYTQRRRDMSPQDEAEFFTLLREAGMEAVLVPSSHIPHGQTYMLTALFELRWV
jgi:predicted nicotinamide N-methyase